MKLAKKKRWREWDEKEARAELERIYDMLTHKSAPYGTKITPREEDQEIFLESQLEAAAQTGFVVPLVLRGDKEGLDKHLKMAWEKIRKYECAVQISYAPDPDPRSKSGVAVIIENPDIKPSMQAFDKFVRVGGKIFRELQSKRQKSKT